MMKIRQSAGKSYAYLIGVFLGDGCVTRQKTKNSGSVESYPVFKLNTIDEDFAQATRDALLEFTNRPVSIHKHEVSKSSKPNYALRCGDPDICSHLNEVTGLKRKLPDGIFDWSREMQIALIVGLMDSEGFVAEHKSRPEHSRYYMGFKSCDIWIPDFLRLLEVVGIKFGKVSKEKPRKPWYKVPTRITIKMQSWIDSGAEFTIARKQQRVERWAKHRLTSEANMPDTQNIG